METQKRITRVPTVQPLWDNTTTLMSRSRIVLFPVPDKAVRLRLLTIGTVGNVIGNLDHINGTRMADFGTAKGKFLCRHECTGKTIRVMSTIFTTTGATAKYGAIENVFAGTRACHQFGNRH